MAVSSNDLGNQLVSKRVNGKPEAKPIKVTIRTRAKAVRIPKGK